MENLDFGQLLEKYLKERGRRQPWLADEIGYSQQTISKWIVNGFRPNSAKVVNQIADALQLDDESRTALLVAADYAVEPTSSVWRKGVPEAKFGTTEQEVSINGDNFIPAEGLSHEGLAHALELAKKTNRRLVLGYALIAVGLAFVITMFVSPVAREATVRTAASIMERLRENSQPDTPSEPTPDIEILPTREPTAPTVLPATPTEAASSTSAPEVAPTAIITVTKSLTTTPPSTATRTSTPTVRPTETITPTPLPVSAYPCDAMIIATSVDTVPLFQTASSTSRDTIAVGEAVQLLGSTTSSRVKIQFNGVEYWVNDDNVSPSTCPN